MPTTTVYLRCVRTATMKNRRHGNWKFARTWDVHLHRPDGERIVRHSQMPESDAARALQARGIKGLMDVHHHKLRQLGGRPPFSGRSRTYVIATQALVAGPGEKWKPPTKPADRTVEVTEESSDWPEIANAEDAAAYAAYLEERGGEGSGAGGDDDE